MTLTRRDLALLLPALVAADANAQELAEHKTDPESTAALGSKAYQFSELTSHSNASGTLKSRNVFKGVTARGQRITLHISELAPGQAPHPPERQPHEEIIILREGTLEVTLNGQTATLGPGSVIFSAFDGLTGWRNVGTTPAQYYALALEEHLPSGCS